MFTGGNPSLLTGPGSVLGTEGMGRFRHSQRGSRVWPTHRLPGRREKGNIGCLWIRCQVLCQKLDIHDLP